MQISTYTSNANETSANDARHSSTDVSPMHLRNINREIDSLIYVLQAEALEEATYELVEQLVLEKMGRHKLWCSQRRNSSLRY